MRRGRKKVLFQWTTCFCANVISSAGIDCYAPCSGCNAKKVRKNILVYTVRKSGKAKHAHICEHCWGGESMQFPVCLLKGPCTSCWWSDRGRTQKLAFKWSTFSQGLQAASAWKGWKHRMCSREAWAKIWCLFSRFQAYRGITSHYSLPCTREGESGMEWLLLGPELCWVKLAVQDTFSSRQFEHFSPIWRFKNQNHFWSTPPTTTKKKWKAARFPPTPKCSQEVRPDCPDKLLPCLLVGGRSLCNRYDVVTFAATWRWA